MRHQSAVSEFVMPAALLPEADAELTRRSIPGSLAYFALWAVILFTTAYEDDHPRWMFGIGAVLLITGICRLSLALRTVEGSHKNPAGYQRWFRIGVYGSAAIWGGFCVLTAILYPAGGNCWLVVLTTAGIAGGGTASLSPRRDVARWYLLILLLPVILWGALSGTDEGHSIGVVSGLYLAFLSMQARHQSAAYWSALVGRDLLRAKALELTDAMRDLKIAKDAAESANQSKSQFLADMSHEIRTPMHGVIGMTDILLEGELTTEQREFVESIRNAGEALLSVINDILDFSKIEAGKLELENIAFELPKLLEDAIGILAEQAQRKGLEVAYLLDPGVPECLRGDPARLRQIVLNFLSNAVKFTSEGEVTVRVEILDRVNDLAKLRVSVSDTGIGLDLEAQQRLFRRFAQADSSVARNYGGTGLGLTICKQLAGLMGGDIGLESRKGHGSRFWFTVQMEAATDSPKIQEVDFRGVRILVVDGHSNSREMLKERAHAMGCEVSCAADGSAALGALRDAIASHQPYHVALVDGQLAVIGGVQLARAIRLHPELDGLQLILLSSYLRRADAEQFEALGFAAHLFKPVRQSHLQDCLATVLRLATEPSPPRAHELLSNGGEAARLHVLLVEDNAVNQRVTLMILKKLGYHSDLASNGLEAVAKVRNNHYDAVLMDWHMPEMDGFEATRVIRQEEGLLRHTLIIAMTASAGPADRARCLDAGMDDYVTKPVRPEELRKVFERHLSLAKPSA